MLPRARPGYGYEEIKANWPSDTFVRKSDVISVLNEGLKSNLWIRDGSGSRGSKFTYWIQDLSGEPATPAEAAAVKQ